jgi:hypothetical protein
MFCRSLFVLSCGHWVVCSSSIYGFWLPLWYLRYTDSEYPFDIFKLFLHYLWTIKYNIKTVRMTICDHLYFVYLKLSFNRFSVNDLCSVRLCLELYVGGLMSFIYVMCVCLHIVVSNTYCLVYFFVLWTLCCQFFWIVRFWLPLRYSLTFISNIMTGI